MQAIEIIMAFLIGLILLIVTALIFKSKSGTVFKLIFNAVLGFIVLFFMSQVGFLDFGVNPVNALICGYLGVFGIGVILLIVYL